MPPADPVLQTRLNGLVPHQQGKVRDIYDLGDTLLIVATDRISAFDYVLGSGIPDKGKVLTQLSTFWFDRTRHIVPNHLIETDVRKYPAELHPFEGMLSGRSMLVRKAKPVPVECVARGYLSGSGWKDYLATGSVCGVALPVGLHESDRLPEPIFTPATKAASGHDVNISETEAGLLVGADLVATLRRLTLALYECGTAHADRCGILLADTKFEFGVTSAGEIILIDEAMTPDSSRYWPKDQVRAGPGATQFRQAVRAGLSRADRLEQTATGPLAPARGGCPDTGEVHRGVSSPHRECSEVMPLREELERLVDDMVTRGVRYEDAQREFEKRFIAHVLHDAEGNLGKAADLLGMHRNTLSRKIAEYRLRRSA